MRPDPQVNISAERIIPVACPTLGEAEARAAYDCVKSGRISQGPLVSQFEQEFAAAHGKKHGVSVTNGTNALLLALVAAGVKEGSRVAVPTLQMVALANVVCHLRALPVFVDSEPDTGNPNPDWLENCQITDRADAIIASGLYGVPPVEFIRGCRKHCPHVPIIEDMAECHYAMPMSGDYLCFSYYANKIVAAGEGGIICLNDERKANRLRSLRSHAFSPTTHFNHTELAYACRWSDLQASVALVQHQRRHELCAARERIYGRYREALTGVDGLTLQPDVSGAARWVFPVICRDEDARDRLRADLAAAGCETRTFFRPLHVQGHLRRYAEHDYPVAEDLASRGIYLPLYAHLSDSEVDYVCSVVRRSLA